MSSNATINSESFQQGFVYFQKLLAAKDQGHAFTNFHEGLAAVWESYKPRLREHALRILQTADWAESDIGSGAILRNVIGAVEIQDSRHNLINNLVFWQNRFGHSNRDHRALLDAISNPKARKELERSLFDLYRSDVDDGVSFDRLSEMTGAKYPLLAYLYFLKDMNRFMPIQPTGFDRAFKAMGIDFSTLRQCNWQNYTTYNVLLSEMRPRLEALGGVKNVRLIDVHSYCWIFSSLLREAAESSIESPIVARAG